MQAAYLLNGLLRENDAVAAADSGAVAKTRPRRDHDEDSGWRDEWIMAWAPVRAHSTHDFCNWPAQMRTKI